MRKGGRKVPVVRPSDGNQGVIINKLGCPDIGGEEHPLQSGLRQEMGKLFPQPWRSPAKLVCFRKFVFGRAGCDSRRLLWLYSCVRSREYNTVLDTQVEQHHLHRMYLSIPE